MNKSAIIISICILIVIIILAIVAIPSEKSANWKHFEYWKSMYMEQPDSLIKRSNGTFDNIARLTFDRVDLSSRQTVDTYLLCSKILINHAVLNDDYKKIAKLYFGSTAARGPIGLQVAESDPVLRGKITAPIRQDITTAARGPIGPQVAESDPVLCGKITAPIRQDSITSNGVDLFDYIYKNCISAILATSNKLKDIRKIVNQFIYMYAYMYIINFNENNDYMKRLNTYYKSMLNVKYHICNKIRHKYIKPIYTSDYQNTMDITVMRSVKSIIEILKESYYNLESPMNEDIKDIINYYRENPHYSKHIVTGLDRLPFLEMVINSLKNASNTHGHIYNISVAELIILLWERIHHPNNKQSIDTLKQALYDALFDCWNRGVGKFIPYCNNGQIAILAGMLAINDFDERTWDIQRTELIKNDIYNDIVKVLNYPNVDQRAIINILLDRKLANPNIPSYIVEIIRYECSNAFL
jgi:hypothetical protein